MTAYRRLYGSARWRATARYVVARAGGICEIRGPRCTGIATAADHIVPARTLFERGEIHRFYDLGNLQAGCASCNSRRGAQLVNAGRRGRPRVHRRVAEAQRLADEADRQYWLEVNHRPAAPPPAPRRPSPRIH